MSEQCKCELDGFNGAITSQNCSVHSCPLTSSSHEKALVRVVEKDSPLESNECWVKDFIQVLCSCGHIINENEIK